MRIPFLKRAAPAAPATPGANRAGNRGREGEDAAAAHLAALGWRIVARNWRHASWELDIVARDGDTLVFVEVKTRAAGAMASAAEALTPEKRRRLIKAARYWLREHEAWALPCRFDLAAVTARDGSYLTELTHDVIRLGEYGDGNPLGGGDASWQPW